MSRWQDNITNFGVFTHVVLDDGYWTHTSFARPVLFLDVDGVLNVVSEQDTREAVAQLHRVVEATGCDIVLSSSWRLGFGGLSAAEDAIRRRLGYEGGRPFLGQTPDLKGQPRGLEIAAWLADQSNPPRCWAVVDDDDDMDFVRHRFVQTNPRVGLDDVAATRLIDLLTSPTTSRQSDHPRGLFDLWCVDTGEEDSESRYFLAGSERQQAEKLLADMRNGRGDASAGSIRRCRRLLLSDLGVEAARFAHDVAEGIRASADAFVCPGDPYGSVPRETWVQWDDEIAIVDEGSLERAMSQFVILEAFVCEGDEEAGPEVQTMKRAPKVRHGCCVDRDFAAAHPEATNTRGCTPETCMELPDGKTCSNCVHETRCSTVFGLKVDGRTHCDWFPRRFVERTPAPTDEGAA